MPRQDYRYVDIDARNKKCELLEELGFTINHHDSDVSYETYNLDLKDFDFSSTAGNAKDLLYTALNHVYRLGFQQGEQITQAKIRSVLGLENAND